mmetsp:Transcript_2561/g.7504  ORF Transcript_2561/g.7504 Transcript_2561/m.7504 type:complete len:106 (+) Transcript_2561:174-491(+)
MRMARESRQLSMQQCRSGCMSNCYDAQDHNFVDIVSALRRLHIKLLAVDFDLTLVDTHTRGAWVGSAPALVSRGRPYLKQLLEEALRTGLYVSIVTFSPQVSSYR